MQCARCHDHKFDPLLQRDYYKLTAVFQAAFDPENWLAANLHYGEWPSRVVLDMAPDQRDTWIQAVTSNTSKERRRQEMLLAATYDRYRKELKAGKQLTAAEREAIRKEIAADPDLEVDPNAPKDGVTEAELEKRFPELTEMKARIEAHALQGERIEGRAKLHSERLGTFRKHRRPLTFCSAAITCHPERRGAARNSGGSRQSTASVQIPRPETSSGMERHRPASDSGRMDGSPENPLIARVFVNRVWQWHFGEGIVRSVDDFGSQGTPPTPSGTARLAGGAFRGA